MSASGEAQACEFSQAASYKGRFGVISHIHTIIDTRTNCNNILERPTEFNAHGNAVAGVKLQFEGPEDSHVDHYVVAARSINENFYRQRITISHPGGQPISPQTLGFNPGDAFYVSVASVDRLGHESLFAYPEVRCDSTRCAIPSYAFDVTAPLPMPPPPPPDHDTDDD